MVGRCGGLLLAATCAWVWSGCAVVTSQPPAEDRRVSDPPVCSTGRGGVAVDSIFAIALGAGAMAAIDQEEGDAALGLGLIGALFVASAVSGHRSAVRCEEANASFATYQDALRAEAADSRGDARRAGPVLARRPAETASDPEPETDPETETETETETEAEAEAEAETDREHEHEHEKPAAEQRKKKTAPPTPGSQAWREFWTEVAP